MMKLLKCKKGEISNPIDAFIFIIIVFSFISVLIALKSTWGTLTTFETILSGLVILVLIIATLVFTLRTYKIN